jgi:hypothetical protein
MEIKWRPIPKTKSLKVGVFLLDKKDFVYLVGGLSPSDEFKDGILFNYSANKKGTYLTTDWITHYVRPSDLTDAQVAFLYRRLLTQRI